MTLIVAAFLIAALTIPHALRLDWAPPVLGIVIWLSALTLRALTALFGAVWFVVLVPTTQLFHAITHWCWHEVLPLRTMHVAVDGSLVGDAALVLPTVALTVSLLSVAFGLWRTARQISALLNRGVLGRGPDESLMVADGTVLIAAAGLRRPRVIVSEGALAAFDEEELAASLAHERGHVVRRHRFVLVAAALCAAFARFVPGTATAARELRFHVERDADLYAVAQAHPPAALASAICKAAATPLPGVPALGLGGAPVTRRVRSLLTDLGEPHGASRLPLHGIAVVMLASVVLGTATLPSLAHAGYHQAGDVRADAHCTR